MPEFRNTPLPPPIAERATETLLEDLTAALCSVGGGIWTEQPNERDVANIKMAQALYAELKLRDVSLFDFLAQLTEATGWLMPELLEDCLQWPACIPYVRERSGLRRTFKCPLCQAEEYPDSNGVMLGTACLLQVQDALINHVQYTGDHEPYTGIVIYRTYTAAVRCRHADDETVLAALVEEYDMSLSNSFCCECVVEELARRQAIS